MNIKKLPHSSIYFLVFYLVAVFLLSPIAQAAINSGQLNSYRLMSADVQASGVPANYDYSVDVTGGGTIEQGKSLHSYFETDLLNGAVNTNYKDLANLTVTGLPAGTDIRFTWPPGGTITPQAAVPYRVNSIGFNSGQSFFDLETTNAAPLGTFTVTYTVTSSITNITHSLQRTYSIVPVSFFSTGAKQAFPAAVPIPQLSLWEQNMATFGKIQCDQKGITAQDWSSWYYDGERAFFQIGDYTGDHTFYDQCASWEQAVYQPTILSGKLWQGYETFTRGMRMNYERNHDPNSQAAVNLLAMDGWGSLPTSAGNTTNSDTMRELSYAIEAMLDSQAVGHAAYPQLPSTVEALLGQLDQVFIAKTYHWYQPFMVGLASEALIQYYNEQSPDPRIPYILKQTLDGMWSQAWDPALSGFYYRCYATVGCVTPSGTYWPIDPGATLNHDDVSPDLGALIAPAYAWMFLQTGDPLYRQRGDTIFASAVQNSALWSSFGDGKQFTQQYRWSFDYVKYRQQANAQASANPLPDTVPPTVSVTTPANGSTASGTIALLASPFDNVGVAAVQFKIDGLNAGAAVTSAIFQTTVQSALYSNGTHTVTAVAYDSAGNSTESAPVSITVNNPGPNAFASCPTNSIPTGSFQGCYFNHGVTNYASDMYSNNNYPPVSLGVLAATTNDPAINFDWAGSKWPFSNFPNSFFGVLWLGKYNFSAGTYAFTVSKDSNTGMRIFVDGQLDYDGWWPPSPPAASSFSLNFFVPATHLIRVELWRNYTNTGDSVFHPFSVSWSGTGGPVLPSGSTGAAQTQGILKLINSGGTYYLIENGARRGITNPGILATYGFSFNQGLTATPDDLAVPQGNTLSPADGALVKSPQDPTVYVISNQQRYAFSSASVFLALGLKFSSVVTVTDPELQVLPEAGNLSNAAAAHLPGLDVLLNGTVYLVGSDSQLHPYPNLPVYNSWHLANNFSEVVPANKSDLALPVGDAVKIRVLE